MAVPTPNPVLFASQNGCKCNASLSDPTVGNDDSAALQAVIDSVPTNSRVIVVIDGPMKLGNVKLRSNVVIQGLGGSSYGTTFPPAGVIQAPNTVCAFRNFNWASNYNGGSPVSDFSTVVDENITVTDLFINGNRGTGTVNNACGGNSNIKFINGADAYANPSTQDITPLLFFGVRNLTVSNVWVYDPDTEALTGAYLDRFLFHNLTIVNPSAFTASGNPGSYNPAAVGTVGQIKVGGSCRLGLVDGVAGFIPGTGMVALTADDEGGNTAYYSVKYPGPITDIEVRAIRAGLSKALFRTWSGRTASPSNFRSLIDRVHVHHCRGTVYESLFYVDGPDSTVGNYGKMIFEDLEADINCGTGNAQIWSIEGQLRDLTVTRLRVNVVGANAIQGPQNGKRVWGYFSGDTQVQGRFTVRDLSFVDNVTGVDADLIQLAQHGNNGWRSVRISQIEDFRGTANTGRVLHMADNCAPQAVTLSDINADGDAQVALFDSAPATVTTSGLTHRTSGAGASLSVSVGVTLPNLRSCGSNVATLAGGAGTITSKKTDATEDA